MSRKALGRGLNALFPQNSATEHDLLDLDIDRLDPSDVQPRSIFRQQKLDELAQSIRHTGIIQPLVVRRNGERFQIIAGERRWRAAQIAGLHRVPCVVKEIPEENVLELSLIENIQREELNPIEEAKAFKKLLEGQHITQDEVARRVGRDRTSITNALRLLKLPQEIQRLVEENKLSMGHARSLLSIDTEDRQILLAREITARSLSVRETEQLVRKKQTASKDPRDSGEPAVDHHGNPESANIIAAESKLSKRLGAPVKIKFARIGGVVEIKFSSSEELSRLFDIMMHTQSTGAG